jgi:hypothetical protein
MRCFNNVHKINASRGRVACSFVSKRVTSLKPLNGFRLNMQYKVVQERLIVVLTGQL